MEVSPNGGGLLFCLWGIRRGCNVFSLKIPASAKTGREVGVRGGSKGYSTKMV